VSELKNSPITTTEELENRLSEPTPILCEAMKKLTGDILLLGVGGKVGPSLAVMARRACERAGVSKRIIGVSSFSTPGLREKLAAAGVETIKRDLLEPGAFESLPDVENVLYMVGRKFGTFGAEGKTWATNVFVAGLAAQRFRRSKLVVFSSGNVYPFVPVTSGGATETTLPNPVGEYGMSCIGRERMFDYISQLEGTRVLHFRLNYAVELRYGVLVDVAQRILKGEPIDLTMGHFNAVWQRYVNLVALQCFDLTSSPARILNVTGPETVSVRWLAERLGGLLDKKPVFVGEEASLALLSNAAECHRLFGYPDVALDRVVEWVAHWLRHGGEVWEKPTHFETRNGRF